MNNQPNNRYRQYTLHFHSDLADAVKRKARELKMTEQKLIEEIVGNALVELPAIDTHIDTIPE